MHKKTFKITDLFITSWTDKEKRPTLSPQQMAMLIDYRYKLDDAKIQKDAKAVGHWSIMILQILRINKSAVSRITVDQVVDCINDIHFFRSPWYFFPDINRELFYAPDEYMHDRTIEQLCYADSAFTKFFVMEDLMSQAHPPMDGGTLSEFELDELIAILYTIPAKFNLDQITDRAKLVNNLPDYLKSLILHSYANIRDYTVKRYPNLFPRAPIVEGQKPKPVHSGPQWRDLLFDFAETEAFKGFDRAKETRIYTALDYLEKKSIQAVEINRNQQ